MDAPWLVLQDVWAQGLGMQSTKKGDSNGKKKQLNGKRPYTARHRDYGMLPIRTCRLRVLACPRVLQIYVNMILVVTNFGLFIIPQIGSL